MAALGGSLGISADNLNHTCVTAAVPLESLAPGHEEAHPCRVAYDLKTGKRPMWMVGACDGWGG